MSVFFLLIVVLGLGALGYVLGRSRAMSSADGNIRNLHSLPNYYGFNVALSVIVPALGLLAILALVLPIIIDNRVSTFIPAGSIAEDTTRSLVMSDVRRVAAGLDTAVEAGAMTEDEAQTIRTEFTDVRERLGSVGVALGSNVEPFVLRAAQSYRAQAATAQLWTTLGVLGVAIAGFAFSFLRTSHEFRARNVVENGILVLLMAAASIAILTTLGIVLSMLFETRNFFQQYNWTDFFFGMTWSPNFRGNSDLGIIPLLWGTLYISFIALLVAVPIGLFAAIYLSEYASNKFRSFAKPAIEILAGIPTIVYGLFALITVGPFLRDYFAQPTGLGESSASVMTAGLVMGIMLCALVDTLWNDTTKAVGKAMSDGSLGIGATRAGTIRQVVWPAAWPGIVDAIVLAASRAIGETMIVVLGAGAAAKLDLNPFEAMTTVTVKIVSQLTGDTDFASPETLVAFALGLTLFVITLGLNVFALYIVRKYREQYE